MTGSGNTAFGQYRFGPNWLKQVRPFLARTVQTTCLGHDRFKPTGPPPPDPLPGRTTLRRTWTAQNFVFFLHLPPMSGAFCETPAACRPQGLTQNDPEKCIGLNRSGLSRSDPLKPIWPKEVLA